MPRPKLTPHQKTILAMLTRMSDNGRRWVPLSNIGNKGACGHLVAKGYAERLEETGPRGGRLFSYRTMVGDAPSYVPAAVIPRQLFDYFGSRGLRIQDTFVPGRGWRSLGLPRPMATADVLAGLKTGGVTLVAITNGEGRTADFSIRELTE